MCSLGLFLLLKHTERENMARSSSKPPHLGHCGEGMLGCAQAQEASMFRPIRLLMAGRQAYTGHARKGKAHWELRAGAGL